MEFLVELSQDIAPDEDPELMSTVKAQEYERAGELVDAGILKRVWRIPGRRALVCLYEVAGPDELHDALSSLPLYPWLDIEVMALAGHHLDPSYP
jgi:muconolactone D-isomerase